MTDKELMQQVLDALEDAKDEIRDWGAYASEYFQAKYDLEASIQQFDKLIEALRSRLAQPEQEPVAYGVLDEDGQIDWTCDYPFCNEPGWPDSVPLYTSPPQREWVGLPESAFAAMTLQQVSAMKYAELLLKEKNNG